MGVFDKIEKIKRSICWDSDFDRSWGSGIYIPDEEDYHWLSWDKKIEEKRLYWKQHGKQMGYLAQEAAFKGNLEVANEFYDKFKEDYEYLLVVGKDLRQRLPVNMYVESMDKLDVLSDDKWRVRVPEHWMNVFRKLHDLDELKKARCEEVLEILPDKSLIVKKWEDFLSDKPDQQAQILLSYLRENSPKDYTYFTAHELVERTGLSLQDTVLWLFVFKHGGLIHHPTMSNFREPAFCLILSKKNDKY